jgi:non-heme chloroperoxidase
MPGLLPLMLAAAAASAAPPTTMVVAADGVPLCVAEAGNPQGLPLLLLHGFGQSHAVFARQFSGELAREFRLIAPDMRGHGCSGKPWAEAAYAGPGPWAGDVAASLRAFGVERPVVIVGWSAGGYWALDYRRVQGAAAVAGLVLAGSHGGLVSAEIDPGLAARMAGARAAAAAAPLDIETAIAQAEQAPGRMAAQPLPADIARIMSASALMLPAYARRVMAGWNLDNSDLAPRLDLPLLFIVGSADAVAPPALVKAVAAGLPAAEVLVYDGAGHATFAEQPARFDRDVAAFARRAYAAAGMAAP